MNNDEKAKEVFAKNLKYYMELYNLNQSELSKIANVSQQSVSYWLNAKLMPRVGAIEKLSNHFGIKKSDLYEEKEGEDQEYKRQVEKIMKKWTDNVGELIFSDEELDELMDYARYILSKRKK